LHFRRTQSIEQGGNIFDPADRWKEPYMSANEFAHEIKAGVRFYGWFEDDIFLVARGVTSAMML